MPPSTIFNLPNTLLPSLPFPSSVSGCGRVCQVGSTLRAGIGPYSSATDEAMEAGSQDTPTFPLFPVNSPCWQLPTPPSLQKLWKQPQCPCPMGTTGGLLEMFVIQEKGSLSRTAEGPEGKSPSSPTVGPKRAAGAA